MLHEEGKLNARILDFCQILRTRSGSCLLGQEQRLNSCPRNWLVDLFCLALVSFEIRLELGLVRRFLGLNLPKSWRFTHERFRVKSRRSWRKSLSSLLRLEIDSRNHLVRNVLSQRILQHAFIGRKLLHLLVYGVLLRGDYL